MEIRFRKLKWRLEDTHPYVIVGGFIGGLILGLALFYGLMFWMISLTQ